MVFQLRERDLKLETDGIAASDEQRTDWGHDCCY